MRLFATNLPRTLSEADLVELFATVGAVKHVNLIRDRITGHSRGFAFITMPDPQEAERAIRDLDQLPMGNQRIVVCAARDNPAIKR